MKTKTRSRTKWLHKTCYKWWISCRDWARNLLESGTNPSSVIFWLYFVTHIKAWSWCRQGQQRSSINDSSIPKPQHILLSAGPDMGTRGNEKSPILQESLFPLENLTVMKMKRSASQLGFHWGCCMGVWAGTRVVLGHFSVQNWMLPRDFYYGDIDHIFDISIGPRPVHNTVKWSHTISVPSFRHNCHRVRTRHGEDLGCRWTGLMIVFQARYTQAGSIHEQGRDHTLHALSGSRETHRDRSLCNEP